MKATGLAGNIYFSSKNQSRGQQNNPYCTKPAQSPEGGNVSNVKTPTDTDIKTRDKLPPTCGLTLCLDNSVHGAVPT